MYTHRYYYDNPNFDKNYRTIWKGYLSYTGNPIPISQNYFEYSNRDLNDIIVEICDINLYSNLENNVIYLSSDCDFNFYYYDFEKTIKPLIENLNIKFNIDIYGGEFKAHEVRIEGDLFKYTISKSKSNIILKKKVLNWDIIETKKSKRKIDDDTKITSDMENLRI
jgi:hypothetical protein